MAKPKKIQLKPSNLEKDPITGAYKPNEFKEMAEMKEIADHR